jgi:GWxTD domain-containing protein
MRRLAGVLGPVALIIEACLSWSCSGTAETTTLDWESRSFSEPGLPYFQIQTFDRGGDENGVEVSLGVSTESVVFVRKGNSFEALCEIICLARDAESEEIFAEVAWIDTVRTDDYRKTRSREIRYMNRFLPLNSGRYFIEVTVTDRHSGKSATRVRRIRVPDVAAGGPVASGIQISFNDKQKRAVPLLGPYLEQGAGMLDCSVSINNLLPGDSVRATVTVLQGIRDTLLPRIPYSFTAVQGSIEHSGMSFDEAMTLFSTTVTFTYPLQSGLVWQLALEEEGVFLMRVEGTVRRPEGAEDILAESSRPLVVVSRGFPRPSGIDQLLGSLEYIMLESEKDSVKRIEGTEEKRKFLEEFWRSVGKNEEAASQLIERYYARVEEANEYFSSFTEGWRTDRGMVYIVLGPPVSVQTGLHGEVWNYSYVEGDRLNSYYFRDVPLTEEFQSLEHLLLERQPYYDQAWFAAVDRWRRGSGY